MVEEALWGVADDNTSSHLQCSLDIKYQLAHTNKNLCNTTHSTRSQILNCSEGSSPLLHIFKCLRFHIDAVPLRLLATLRELTRTNEKLRAELNAQLNNTAKTTHRKCKHPQKERNCKKKQADVLSFLSRWREVGRRLCQPNSDWAGAPTGT